MAEEDAPAPDPGTGEMEERWLRFWNDEKVYAFDPSSSKPVFSIDTPPPTVSGKMHIGHAYSYNQMDFTARYKRMRGFNLLYPFGFDDNGLPTERLTEREVGVKLADVGRQEFIRRCLETTGKFEAMMEESWRRIGTSCDWSIVYRTIDKPVIKISQHSFLKLFAEDRAYRAERPGIWCPECATAIAQVEMEDRSLPSTFNDIAFDLLGEKSPGHLIERRTVPGPEANSKPREVLSYHQGSEGKIVISTTRPELIPACVAIFVHPDDARTRHLIGRKVRVPVSGNEVPVLTSDKVDKETGTGVVMNCTFGDLTDVEWWQANNLPLRIVIGPKGVMTEAAAKYAGQSVAHARDHILRDLNGQGRLLHQTHIEHAVNVHERCGTPVEFLVTKQWFVRYLDLKEKFLARGESVDWHPAYMRVRYENWVKGLKWDWCISRQRYFGVPFPVWYCQACDAPKVAKPEDLPVDPTVDKAKGACAQCGGTEFRGESDVMDTWATSSLTPQITLLTAAPKLGIANATIDDLDSNPKLAKLLPMSLRPQAHEIISFWAFNTIVKAHFHHGKAPWTDAQISGFVKLGKGKKMSKSKGNVVEPLDVIREHSGDALRYWSATGASLGEDIIWNPKDLTRAQRLVTKLRNIEGFTAKACGATRPAKPDASAFSASDKWVLTEFSRLVADVTALWDGFDYTKALKETENFVWHVLADHYLELVKHRLYGPDGPAKQAAQWTLWTVGLGVLKLFAPVLVFSTEDMYQAYFRAAEGEKSVHVSAWPGKVLEDAAGHHAGSLVKDVVAAVRNWKSQAKLPLNAELAPIEVVASPEDAKALESGLADIQGTTKARGLRFVAAGEIRMTPVAVEPNLSKIGPKYKQAAGAIKEALKEIDPSKVTADGLVVRLKDGAEQRLDAEDYTIKSRPTLHGRDVERIEVGNVTLLLSGA